MIADLNRLYRSNPAWWDADYQGSGFSWIDCGDQENSVFSFMRRDRKEQHVFIVILNLTPVVRHSYRIGLPLDGAWEEVFNSDAEIYGGSNQGNQGQIQAQPIEQHGKSFSATFTLPPLGVVIFSGNP